MTASVIGQYAVFFTALALVAVPLGRYLARVYAGDARPAQRILGPFERAIYRMCRIDCTEEMSWQRYATSLLVFNLLGLAVFYLLERWQHLLPLNPAHLGPVARPIAFNTAVSFVTNTNWQAYAGETTLSHLTQMAALTVQNFVSAATGMAVAVTLARAFVRSGSRTLGNFWVDLTRGVVYILLPLSVIVCALLISQGVVQTFAGHAAIEPVEGRVGQILPLGPVASQVAIKQLGSNGGGFFNTNSAHPFENPTPLTNLIEMFCIILLPAAFCFTFAKLVRSPRHGWMLSGAMLVLLLPMLVLCAANELNGHAELAGLRIDPAAGNLEGKEIRFGPAASALWATLTTATSNGSVNAMHDSFMPLGGLAPLWLMQLGEVAFGGVGAGIYGIVMFAVIAVFLAGLMIGRTPELLGKKLAVGEMTMASLTILLPALAILVGTAVACFIPSAWKAAPNPGPHGFTEILYAFSSAANNNGSAFAGLDASRGFYAWALAACMVIGRYGVIVPVLAAAGSIARRKITPGTAGTLPTDTLLFAALLVGTVLLVGALTFLPALALGPIIEHTRLALSAGGQP